MSTAERWVCVYKLTRNVELALERNTVTCVRHNGIFLNSTWRTENGVKWLFVHEEGDQEKQKTTENEKKRSERRKHCALAVVTRS